MIEPVPSSAMPVWEAALHDPVACATVLLVIVTTGLWICTFLLWRATVRLATEAKKGAEDQARKMEQSIAEAAKASQAMERQNEIAIDTSKRQLRPYVCLKRAVMEDLAAAPDPVIITLELENTGATPANKWHYQWACRWTDQEPTSTFYESALAQHPINDWNPDFSFGPRQSKLVPNQAATITQDVRRKVISGELKFFFMGRMWYVDTFGDQHITEFFYIYSPALPNRLGQAPVHNCIF